MDGKEVRGQPNTFTFLVSMPILDTEIVDILVNNEIYCYCILVVGKLISSRVFLNHLRKLICNRCLCFLPVGTLLLGTCAPSLWMLRLI